MRCVRSASLAVVIVAGVGASPAAFAQEDRELQAQYDKIVDDFIAYDVGQLRGAEGQQAYQRFQQLNGSEAIPALVRGANKAARIQSSCPIIVICAKLQQLLASTRDRKMLRYAADNLNGRGQGVFYANYVESLRQYAQQALNQGGGISRTIQGGGTAAQLRRSQTPLEKWTVDDLLEAAGEEEGANLVRVLEELKDRKGGEYTAAFAKAIASLDEEQKDLARGLLAQRLVRMTDATIKAKLGDRNAEIRAAAARAIGYKGSPICAELAGAVRDGSRLVGQNAHATLTKLLGEDVGLKPDEPSRAQWFAASKRWETLLQERESTSP